jgi:hypothetical protein
MALQQVQLRFHRRDTETIRPTLFYFIFI